MDELRCTKYLHAIMMMMKVKFSPGEISEKDTQTDQEISDNLTCFLLVTEVLPEKEDSIFPCCEEAMCSRVSTSNEIIWFESVG